MFFKYLTLIPGERFEANLRRKVQNRAAKLSENSGFGGAADLSG
jgi:hypothetical protein